MDFSGGFACLNFFEREINLWLLRVYLFALKRKCLKKIGYIADYEGRSVNSYVLVLIRENIKAFEAENGEIKGKIKPEVNVKLTRK